MKAHKMKEPRGSALSHSRMVKRLARVVMNEMSSTTVLDKLSAAVISKPVDMVLR